ncbi:unnamed protein product [Clonostachys rosea f. rosea IK726]|uniref:Cupin type-2 domain-containing protein n=2 Tax=Bionectria ochroleuca TaxID=29856 RepID=A0A0B7KPZ3_BIOOC|nr:unnamed protein product [Clonostachys rosea f. rosea IK726]
MSHTTTTQDVTLGYPRVIRASHSPETENSVFSADHDVTPFKFGPHNTGFAVFDSRDAIPVTNTDPIPSFPEAIPRTPPQGATVCTVDFQPGSSSPMHRTLSIDYCIVVTGEILLRLDSGAERVVKAGEYIIQEGANHQWFNNSEHVCRIFFVSLAANPILSKEGQPLLPDLFQKEKELGIESN